MSSPHFLEKMAPFPLSLSWHENQKVYLSVQKKGKGIHLHLHRLFFQAPTPVLEAILSYVTKKDRPSRAVIKQMAHLYFSEVTLPKSRLKTEGKIYNLQVIFEQMEKLMPKEPLEGVSIGWSKRSYTKSFRSITFGSFDRQKKEIRIHPILDQEGVPLYFVEYIVYHEMLHAVYPSIVAPSGRCSIHTKEFLRQEALFPKYKEAKIWERQSLQFFQNRARKKGVLYGRS